MSTVDREDVEDYTWDKDIGSKRKKESQIRDTTDSEKQEKKTAKENIAISIKQSRKL